MTRIVLAARYPERELEIRRLYVRDADFRAVCEDYEEASAALKRWEEAGDEGRSKAEDYRQLLLDLESETLSILDRPRGLGMIHDQD